MSTEPSTPTRDDEGTNQNGYTILSIGERYPGTIPTIGCQICLTDTLEVLVRMERPSRKEVEQFRRISAYGFYAGSDLPHGVLIWHFSHSLSFETPFNPRREETIRSDEVRAFLRGKANICRRVLLDENGTVLAFGLLGMDWELVGLLREKWGDPNLDWSDYERRYERLIAGVSSQELWAKARKWPVTNHFVGGDMEEPKGNASEAKPCGKCEAAHAAVARLRAALKQAERREEEQGRKAMEAQSQATALAKDKVDLQARIASLSAGALQQEVAALKAIIQEREFRILEMEEELLERDRQAKPLEGKVDDLGRRIRWLENRLRMNGIAVS